MRAGAKKPRSARVPSPPEEDDGARARIDPARIIDRLTAFVNGEIELTSPQVTAALGLLKKSLPDLATTTLSDPSGGPLTIEVVKFTDAAAKDPE